MYALYRPLFRLALEEKSGFTENIFMGRSFCEKVFEIMPVDR